MSGPKVGYIFARKGAGPRNTDIIVFRLSAVVVGTRVWLEDFTLWSGSEPSIAEASLT